MCNVQGFFFVHGWGRTNCRITATLKNQQKEKFCVQVVVFITEKRSINFTVLLIPPDVLSGGSAGLLFMQDSCGIAYFTS